MDGITPSWQDVAERWLKAYEETKAELERVKGERDEARAIALAQVKAQVHAMRRNHAEVVRVDVSEATAEVWEWLKDERDAALQRAEEAESECERLAQWNVQAVARAKEAEKRAETLTGDLWEVKGLHDDQKRRAHSAEALVETLAYALESALDNHRIDCRCRDCAALSSYATWKEGQK